jgi:hypothetical protein
MFSLFLGRNEVGLWAIKIGECSVDLLEKVFSNNSFYFDLGMYS